MAIPEPVTLRTRLRCEVAIPSGLRHGRMLVRLRQPEPQVLELLPARGLSEATHQIVNVWTKPLLTRLAEGDAAGSGELLRSGFWEPAESLALMWLARPGASFVDAGATLGYYSVLLAHLLQENGHVYAFEPEAENVLVLTANALLMRQLFPQAARIEVFPFALSDREGSARLNVFEQSSGMHSLVHGAKDPVFPKPVPMFPLDAVREAMPQRINLLKADVRGSELPLLRGAKRILEQDRPVLCVKFDPQANGAEACAALAEWLRDLGYTAFRLFQASAADSYQAMVDAVAVWTAAELIDQVRRKAIGTNGTIVALADTDRAVVSETRMVSSTA